MKKVLVIATLVAIGLSGCGEEKTRTAEYYMQEENKAEYEAKLAECKNNPGELLGTPNCINAIQAQQQIFRSKNNGSGYDRQVWR